MNGNTPPPRQGLGESAEPSVRKKQPNGGKPPRERSNAGQRNKANKDDNVMNWLHPSDNRGVLMEFVKRNPEHYGKLERRIGSLAKIIIQSNKIVLTKRVEQESGAWKKECKKALQDFFRSYTVRQHFIKNFHNSMLEDPLTHAVHRRYRNSSAIVIAGLVGDVERRIHALKQNVSRTSVRSSSCPRWVFELITYHIDEACYAFPEIQITNHEGIINITGHPNEVNRVHERLKAIIAPYNEAQISVRKEYHKCIIGRNGQKLTELQNKHEVSIIVPLGNCDDTSIIIRGMGYHVKAAQLEIENLVAGVIRNERSTLLMPIQPSHRCRLKNTTLQSIERDHGVSAKWQSAGEILLTGPNERLKQSQNALVQELESTETKVLQVPFWLMPYLRPFINKEKKTWPEVTVTNTDNSLRICGHHTEVLPFHSNLSKTLRDLEENKCFQTIQVSRKFHGVLIGKKGQTIKRLKSKYNVEIKIPDEKEGCDEVTILGDKGKVKAAQLEIENLVAGAMRNERSTLLMSIRPCHRSRLKNATFQSIKRDHGVDAKWQSEGEVLLTGPNEKLKQAQDALVQELESTETKELQVPFWLMPYLRPFINEEKKNWPEVTVTNTDNGLRICGHRTEGLPFHSNLSKTLRDLKENKCFQTIQVSRKFHGVLIGKKGQTINHLTSKYNVEIKIPDNKEGLDEVTVLGNKHDVEAAKKEILEVISIRENSESKTVRTPNVPERHLSSCIANLRKQFPEIKIEKKQRQRSITLIGNRELVDQASLSLQEKFNHLKRSIKTVNIPMEGSQLLGIVGWKHSSLKQLQAKHKDISIRYDVRPPKVTIKGEEEKVEKAHIDIVAMLPSLMGFCVAEIEIQVMARFIGKGGSNITRLKAEFPKVRIETPRRESGDDCVIVIGNRTDVQHFFNRTCHYGTTMVRCHTEVPERRHAGPPGSLSPQKRQMRGSQSSLSSCMSSNYGDGYDSDESAGSYQDYGDSTSLKAVLLTYKIPSGLGKFLSLSEKHSQNLKARLPNTSVIISKDTIRIAGQTTSGEMSWTSTAKGFVDEYVGQFRSCRMTFSPLSSVARQDYSDDDLTISWSMNGESVAVAGLEDRVMEKRKEYEEVKQRKRYLSYSWPCKEVHFISFLRGSLSERQHLEKSLKDFGNMTINDGDITISGDVLEIVAEEDWIDDCKSTLDTCFSQFAIEYIDIPFLLTGEMRNYCDFQTEVMVDWSSENSSMVVYGKRSEVTSKANSLKRKLDELKNRKDKVSLTWTCADENVFNFVKESTKQQEEFVKFLGEIGSPVLTDGTVIVRNEILQTESKPEWENKCRAMVIEFFSKFMTMTVDVTEDKIRFAEAATETRSSVVTKWIPEKKHLQVSGVTSDVYLRVDLIKKKMERSENQSRPEMTLPSSTVENVKFSQEGSGVDEFSLSLQLTGAIVECVIASQKEHELHRVKIVKQETGVKLCGKKYDLLLAKRFIDSLAVDELDVKTYGAFEFLSDSTIGLQIEHIGIKHNCTILVERVMDTVWKDRRFICLPAEMDTASLFGSLTVCVEEGDITADGSDMIVNTSDKSFSFRGPLSRAIFSKAGEALKTQFLLYGKLDTDMGVTSGGSLKCKKILHVAIPASNESMEDLVHKILKTANDHAMTSITLPTIGAGGGGWSYQDVAVGMRRGIAKFVKLEPNPTYLKKVKVMLYSSVLDSEKKKFYNQLTKTGYKQKAAKLSVKESQPTLMQRVFSYFSRQPKPEPAAEASAKTQDDDNRSHTSEEKASEAKKTDHGEFAKITVFSNNDESVKSAKKEMEKFVGQNLKTFVIDNADILKLKQAHIEKLRKVADEQKVRVIINGENKNHVITIQGVNEYASHAKEETQRILSGLTSDLPETWCDMPDGQKVMRVPLSPSSAEYQKVEQRFTKANVRSMYTNFSITKIERVQNPTLYRQYQSKKAEIAARSSTSGKIDRKLFHGTDSDTVNKIYNDVFNRSYAGKNATLYGKGVYFSTQSSYSDSYTAGDYSGTRQMFLARVLTGDFCKGKSSMVDPPPNPRTKELYDSVVDNDITPTIFVVFRDWSVYPLYIITYRRT